MRNTRNYETNKINHDQRDAVHMKGAEKNIKTNKSNKYRFLLVQLKTAIICLTACFFYYQSKTMSASLIHYINQILLFFLVIMYSAIMDFSS